MINLFYVAAGGALGSSLRYFSNIIFKYFFPNFPLGTIFVNILGCFLIGILMNNFENRFESELFIKYFLVIGILGSFTTFSAFSIDVIDLINNKKIGFAIFYIFTSIVISIIAAYLGYNYNKI